MSEEKEREERIAARRARISAAREAARNGGPGPDGKCEKSLGAHIIHIPTRP